jgi:hypothetical protein
MMIVGEVVAKHYALLLGSLASDSFLAFAQQDCYPQRFQS